MKLKINVSRLLKSDLIDSMRVDAALGAATGVLFGMLFGGLSRIGSSDLWSAAQTPLSLGLLGGIVVPILGLFDRTGEAAESPQVTESSISPVSRESRSCAPEHEVVIRPVRMTPKVAVVGGLRSLAKHSENESWRTSI